MRAYSSLNNRREIIVISQGKKSFFISRMPGTFVAFQVISEIVTIGEFFLLAYFPNRIGWADIEGMENITE